MIAAVATTTIKAAAEAGTASATIAATVAYMAVGLRPFGGGGHSKKGS